jgi:hypothetical protein
MGMISQKKLGYILQQGIACDKLLRPESASNSAAFQDGDQQIYQGFNPFRYVDNVSRFDRRLLPYSYFPQWYKKKAGIETWSKRRVH